VTPGRATLLAALSGILSVGAAASPPHAHAAPATPSPAVSAPLQRGLSDGRLLANADPALRAAGIEAARRVGARVGRIPIGWSTVVSDEGFARPDESVLPLSDPANATYRWARIDASVRDLVAGGLEPLAYLMAAPPWAQSAPRYAYATPGTWAPRPDDVAAFASAVARRYDGTYPDPLTPGRALPRIARFQTWNEPNLARYLGPQWLAVNGTPQLFSARWYRAMHTAAYAAIHARQPGAQVGLAGLAPTGAAVDGTGRTGPLRFLRALLCLGDQHASCGPPLPFDALALHPLSVGDPDRPARLDDDLALADLAPKTQQLLADASAAGRLRTGPPPELWITELNWTSAPGNGIAPDDQAAVVGRAMMRLERAGATIVNWQFATDPPTDRTGGEERPAGLTTNQAGDPRRLPGTDKPFAAGFAFPAAAVAAGDAGTLVWALAPPQSTGAVVVEARRAGVWRRAGQLPLRPGGVAYGLINRPIGTLLRVRIGAAVTAPIRSTVRLRLRRAAGTTPTASRLGTETPEGEDPRPLDLAGPGWLPALPPLLPGGTPPSPGGRPIPPVPAPSRPLRRLHLIGTAGADVLIGSSGADRLVGGGGNDILIGLGGDDRFGVGAGQTLIVRGNHVVRR
jgi:hypothetical protein